MALSPIIREKPPEVPPEPWHGCFDGYVYLGIESVDENGEHVEEIERVPCRRCRPDTPHL